MPIKVLSAEVANQIAAGEVVERPASVVKELIENSLDAGAGEIRVEVREGGRRLIRVQDDGCGIATEDTSALFQRHATSKILSAEDLDHLTTLGFRGEALASISSVAQVSLLTRPAKEDVGWLVRTRAEGLVREPHGTPPGTTVTVEHLFANVPARLKFLKQPATEAGHIQQIVTRYALAYPERRFSLVSDGKLAFQSTGSGKLYDVLVKVYGLDMAAQMLEVAAGDQAAAQEAGTPDEPPAEELAAASGHSWTAGQRGIRVTGYVGTPGLHRSNRSYITLYVNRRWFQDNSLSFGVIQAYHTLLPTGRYPVAVVFIEMDPADVDVNVHPTKAEVRFRESNTVFGAVQRTVRRTLTEHAPIPQVGVGGGPPTYPEQPAWQQTSAWSMRRDALLGAGSGHDTPLVAPPERESSFGRGDSGFATPPPGERAAGGAGAEGPVVPPMLTPPKIPLLRVVGQLAATYIVAEGPDGMYLIDQHAAHERILFEGMMASHIASRLAVQPLLEPVVLELSPEQAAVVDEGLPVLNEWGVGIEPFGGQSYLVRSLPAVLNNQNPHSALAEIMDGLVQGLDAADSAHEARLVTLICKRAAIKGGQVLSMAEMQEMVRQLELCAAPRTCPHGRPTMIHVSATDLARQFGRI